LNPKKKTKSQKIYILKKTKNIIAVRKRCRAPKNGQRLVKKVQKLKNKNLTIYFTDECSIDKKIFNLKKKSPKLDV
jgi:rRNA pseudouridine-1189 N-methylase Emg1 (Nep1/Mra1 family)